ncbi:MAG: acyltransferase [Actinomycetota bacterium]|nr:acyltransferase [Actinomycetota bacterium]
MIPAGEHNPEVPVTRKRSHSHQEHVSSAKWPVCNSRPGSDPENTAGLLWWTLDGGSSWLYRGGLTLAALATAGIIPSVALVPDGAIARALRVGPLRWLGSISYGVYLWHWPVQLVLTHAATGLQGAALLLLRLIVTIALAEVSYRLLELPIRRRRVPSIPRIAWFATLSVGVAGVVAAAAVLVAPPVPQHPEVIGALGTTSAALVGAVPSTVTPTGAPAGVAPARSSTTAAPEVTTSRPPPTAPTTTVPPLTPTYRVAVLGDSVAQSIARGLNPVKARYGLDLFDDSILGCGVAPAGRSRLAGVEHDLGSDCVTWEQTWTDRLQRDRPQVAVIQLGRHEVLDRERDGRWTNILETDFAAYVTAQVDHSVDVAGSAGGAVVLLTAPYYQGGERPDGGQWPENDPARVDRFNDILRQVAARHPRVVLVDLGGRTNPSGRYASTVAGVAMRQDGVHYTAQACAWFAPWLVPQVRDAAAKG